MDTSWMSGNDQEDEMDAKREMAAQNDHEAVFEKVRLYVNRMNEFLTNAMGRAHDDDRVLVYISALRQNAKQIESELRCHSDGLREMQEKRDDSQVQGSGAGI